MVSPFQIYILTVVGGLKVVFGVTAGIFAFLAGICLLDYAATFDRTGSDARKPRWARIRRMSSVFFATMVLTAATPTTSQCAAIVILPKILNNEKLQTAGNALYDLTLQWVDSLKPDARGGERR